MVFLMFLFCSFENEVHPYIYVAVQGSDSRADSSTLALFKIFNPSLRRRLADLLDQRQVFKKLVDIRLLTGCCVPDVCFFRNFVERSVGQWRDGYGEIHDRFWSESLAHSLHTGRRAIEHFPSAGAQRCDAINYV